GDERARGRTHLLPVQRHEGLALMHEVDLLLPARTLIVLGDEHVAGVLGDGVDAERGDPEVVANGFPGRRPALLDGTDLVARSDLPARSRRAAHCDSLKVKLRRAPRGLALTALSVKRYSEPPRTKRPWVSRYAPRDDRGVTVTVGGLQLVPGS